LIGYAECTFLPLANTLFEREQIDNKLKYNDRDVKR